MKTDELLEKLRKVIREEVKAEVAPVKNDLQGVKSELKNVKESLKDVIITQQDHTRRLEALTITQQDHTRRLRGIKMVLTRVRKDVKFISGDYDERIVENYRDIQEVRKRLKLPPYKQPRN